MIKNILLNLLLSISLILPAKAQDLPEINTFSTPQLNASIFLDNLTEEQKSEENFVTNYKDVEFKVGGVKLKSPFIHRGQVAPMQGWILPIGHLIKINKFIEGCKSTCNILSDVIEEGYKEKLEQCQIDCDARVKQIGDENSLLRKNNKELTLNLESEKTAKIVWAVVSVIGGAGLGILVYEIAR